MINQMMNIIRFGLNYNLLKIINLSNIQAQELKNYKNKLKINNLNKPN